MKLEEMHVDYSSALHAANHAACACAPVFAQSSLNDLKTEHNHQRGMSGNRMLFYDNTPGGLGISDALYDCILPLMIKAKTLLQLCSCVTESGCFACCLDARCTNFNEYLHKRGAAVLLSFLISFMSDNTADTQEIGVVDALSPTKQKTHQISMKKSKLGVVGQLKGRSIQGQWSASLPSFRTEEK